MKYHTLHLKNWRCFEGEHEVDFSTSDKQHVTGFFAINGAGKSALLEAMRWLFYGEVDALFENPDQLICESAIRNSPSHSLLETKVSCEFERDGKMWTASRTGKVQCSSSVEKTHKSFKQNDLIVCPDGGTPFVGQDAESWFQEIIPKEISNFFFCSGETLKKEFIDSDTETEYIPQSMREWYGIARLERLSKHANSAYRSFLWDQGQLTEGDTEAAKRLHALEEEQKKVLTDKAQNEANLASLESQFQQIDSELSNLQKAKELQKERERAEQEIKSQEKARSENMERRRELLVKQGYIAFLSKPQQKLREITADLDARGLLPAPLRGDFASRLISENTCICGRDLEPDSPAFQKILEYRDSDPRGNRNEIVRLDVAFQKVNSDQKSFIKAYEREQQKLDEITSIIRKEERKRDEASSNISAVDDTRVQELERQRLDLKKKQGQTTQELVEINQRLADFPALIRQAKREHDQQDKLTKRGELIKKCAKISDSVSTVLQKVHDLIDEGVRQQVSSEVTKSWRKHMNDGSEEDDDWVAECTHDYKIRLLTASRTDAGASTGQKLMLAFCFIASLIRTRNEAEPDSDSNLPIFVDAPFSVLSNEASEECCKLLPSITRQLILTFLNKQYQTTEDEILSPLTGKAYCIVKGRSSDKHATVTFNNEEYCLTSESVDKKTSQILEIEQ